MIKTLLIKYLFYLYKYLTFLFKKSNIQSTLLYTIFIIYTYNKYISKYLESLLKKNKTFLNEPFDNIISSYLNICCNFFR